MRFKQWMSVLATAPLILSLAGAAHAAPDGNASQRRIVLSGKGTGVFERREGALVHKPSGMSFPLEVGQAKRVSERIFSDDGDYVGVRYGIPLSDGATARVLIGMVALPGMTAREHYLSRRAVVLNRIARPETLLEGPLADLDFDNFSGRFTNGRMVEGLITAQFGNWGVRAETEYPADRQVEAHKAVEAFLLALDWQPLRTAAAGGDPR